MAVAHLSHLLSVFVLYRICMLVSFTPASKTRAFLAASLHVFAPAGLFLSAPYTESPFSLLSFGGYYAYLLGSRRRTVANDLLVMVAGLLFGVSATFRSNGIINGSIFAFDFLARFPSLNVKDIRYRAALAMGAILTAGGFLLPQYLAYCQYCTFSDSTMLRPWCKQMVPSIYNYVQRYYWQVPHNCGY